MENELMSLFTLIGYGVLCLACAGVFGYCIYQLLKIKKNV